MTTPRLSDHARDRCVEMGLSTKRVKHAFRDAVHDYPGKAAYGPGRRVCVADGLAIVYEPDEVPLVITVLWHRLTARTPPLD